MKNKKSPSQTWGTLSYFKNNAWHSMNTRAINGRRFKEINKSYKRKGIKILFSKQEFYNWCNLNKNKIMYHYKKNTSPSIDRINPNKHYSLDNIRILDWTKNIKKGQINATKQSALVTAKPIIAIHKYTKKTIKTKSIQKMANILKISASYISNILVEKRTNHTNYYFKLTKVSRQKSDKKLDRRIA